MKKRSIIFISLALVLCLAACGPAAEFSPAESPLPTATPAPTPEPTPTPEAAEPLIILDDAVLAPIELQPVFTLPGLSADDAIRYFAEVCLDAEFNYNGRPDVVQKWAAPIYYMVFGPRTDEDMEAIHALCDWLNGLEGFPGIYEVEDAADAALCIYYCTPDEMLKLVGESFAGMDGAVTFWYLADEIYQAIICVRTDLDQSLRRSVALEELYNCMGPVQDTSLRPDSLIYAEFSCPQWMTEEDALVMELLYYPAIECGMDAQRSAEVIRQIYFES